MDVSKREALKMEMLEQNQSGETSDKTKVIELEIPQAHTSEVNGHLAGENLIQTLVALTGLPEGMANDEMDQVLQISGHAPEKRSEITLDELRTALIAYLEALEPTCSE